MFDVEQLVRQAYERNASDIHLVCGLPIRVRIDGMIRDLNDTVLTPEVCEGYAEALAGKDFNSIRTMGELDVAKTFGSIRARVNVFRQQRTFSAAIRLLDDHIPDPRELKLPPVVQGLADLRSGLVLVTGETGVGKSTTLAALLDEINHNRPGHIITLEDPIEYVYTPDQCIVNQRQIGTDTESYASGLRSILREDPDIILIGEMRDLNTIESALTAAETGHLVFSTLHTNSAADTIDRILGVFPEGKQRQIRIQVSTTLRAVISQELLPRKFGTGRVAACEVMLVNHAIANLIREGKTAQIESFIGLGTQEGCISMDNALLKLVRDGEISRETAMAYARSADFSSRL